MLSPYATKPSRRAAGRLCRGGRGSPRAKATPKAPSPDPNPLMTTISSGSLWEIMRVQLFSSPQQTQAPSTSRDPDENCRLLASSKERIMLARVIRPMANHSRWPIVSWNTASAIREVATISKLFKREAWAGEVRARPAISRMGAAMSSRTIPMV